VAGVHRREGRGLKFSYRQILASAGGAVLSAVIASIFGVKGTIVGVAIGSVAATVGTALLFQSIERTRTAVQQVVLRAPDGTRLLNRLGGTNAAGVTRSEAAGVPPSTSAGETDDAAPTESSAPAVTPPRDEVQEAAVATRIGSGIRWPVVAGVVVAVFVFSLLFVTVVELIAGRPLADLFGHHGGGTTVDKIFENNPAPTLPTPTTTTSTASTTTTTTTSSSSTTTSVGGSTTSSTGVGSTSTTTTGLPDTSTSTTAAAG
jgi:hypothetical protein